MTPRPILPGQRVLCLALRGTLSQVQAARVACVPVGVWNLWEREVRGAPALAFQDFKKKALAMFPSYRPDVSDGRDYARGLHRSNPHE